MSEQCGMHSDGDLKIHAPAGGTIGRAATWSIRRPRDITPVRLALGFSKITRIPRCARTEYARAPLIGDSIYLAINVAKRHLPRVAA